MNGFQWLAAGWWVFPVSTTNKIDRHNITEILLKVALSIIPLSHNHYNICAISIHISFNKIYYTKELDLKTVLRKG
jgi:hypothetical protein